MGNCIREEVETVPAIYMDNERLDVFEAKIEESEKDGSCQVSWVRFLVTTSLFAFLYFHLKKSLFQMCGKSFKHIYIDALPARSCC